MTFHWNINENSEFNHGLISTIQPDLINGLISTITLIWQAHHNGSQWCAAKDIVFQVARSILYKQCAYAWHSTDIRYCISGQKILSTMYNTVCGEKTRYQWFKIDKILSFEVYAWSLFGWGWAWQFDWQTRLKVSSDLRVRR